MSQWILNFPAYGEEASTCVTNYWLRQQLKEKAVHFVVPIGGSEITKQFFQSCEVSRNVERSLKSEVMIDMAEGKEVFVFALAWADSYDPFPYPFNIEKAFFRGN